MDVSYYEGLVRELLEKTGLPFIQDSAFDIHARSISEKSRKAVVRGSFGIGTGKAIFPFCEPYIEKIGKFRLVKRESDPHDGYECDIELKFSLLNDLDAKTHVIERSRDEISEICSYYTIQRGIFRKKIEEIFEENSNTRNYGK